MWIPNLEVACYLCVIVFAGPCCCDPLLSSYLVDKPSLPKAFNSPGDLRTYLDQLSKYYVVLGRPRFGKRTVAAKPAAGDPIPSYPYQEQCPPRECPDLLDFLQQYYPQQEQE